DIATRSWVGANYALITSVYTKAETNNLLDLKANVNGNNLTNIQTWRNSLGIGTLANLTTTYKTDLVGAINEVKGSIPSLTNYVDLTSNQTIDGAKSFRSLNTTSSFSGTSTL